MYVRRTQTRSSTSGERYYTHRLVQSKRIGDKVKQITLLNLGRHFDVDQDHWPLLCTRIDELLSTQPTLVPLDCPPAVERHAQRIAAQLVTRGKESALVAPTAGEAGATSSARSDIQSVKVLQANHLRISRSRGMATYPLQRSIKALMPM